jgi:hypothetical protein
MNTEPKKVGRPKGPAKVLWRKRVTKEVAALLNEVSNQAVRDVYENTVTPVEVRLRPDSQILALLDDVERLEREKAELLGKLDRLSRMSESELVQGWIRKYDALRASMVKGEFDQSN